MSLGLSRLFLDVREALRSLLWRLDAVDTVEAMDTDLEPILARLFCDAELGLAASDIEGAVPPVLLLIAP